MELLNKIKVPMHDPTRAKYPFAVRGPKNGSAKLACRAAKCTEHAFTGVNSKLTWRAARLQSSCTGVHSRTRQHRGAMALTMYYADHRSDGD
jgi:hypothetical protein